MAPRDQFVLRATPAVYARLRGLADAEEVSVEVIVTRLLDMYDRAAVLGLRPAHPLTHQLSPERKDGTT